MIHCFDPFSTHSSPTAAAVEVLAARERRNEASALLVGPERENRQRDRARVHRDRHPHAGVGARELLQHEDVREKVGARATVLLGDTHAHEPELGELRDQLVGEPMVTVPVGRVRDDLRLGELSGQPLDRALVAGQLEVHRC